MGLKSIGICVSLGKIKFVVSLVTSSDNLAAHTNMCANRNTCCNFNTCTALQTEVCAVHMYTERWIHTFTDFVFPILWSFYYAFSMLKLINIVILFSNHQCIIHLNHSKRISSTYINILIYEELCHARFQFSPNVPWSISVHYEELIR